MNVRVIAWVNDQEWFQIYNQIFYGSNEEKKHALEVLKVWRLRFSNKTPVAIETTCTLLEAYLFDQNIVKSLRQQFMSAAILQFVSLVAEQNRVQHGIRLGDNLSLPEWLIDIRHQIAHGPFPSLTVLEKAVTFCLEWLKVNHWDQQAEVNPYCNIPYMDLNNEKHKAYSLDNQIFCILTNFQNMKKINHDFSIGNNMTELKTICKSSFAIQRLCVGFVLNSHFQFNYEEINKCESNSESCVPLEIVKFWQPVIKLICDFLKLPTFLFCFVFKLCSDDYDSIRSMLTNWAIHIINFCYIDKKAMLLFQKDPLLNETLKLLLSCNDAFAAKVFDRLSKVIIAKFGQKKFNQLCSLKCLVAPKALKQIKVTSSDCAIHTVNEVQDLLELRKNKQKSFQTNTWKLHDGESLQDCRFGLLPNQSLKSFSHLLYDFPNFDFSKPQAYHEANEMENHLPDSYAGVTSQVANVEPIETDFSFHDYNWDCVAEIQKESNCSNVLIENHSELVSETSNICSIESLNKIDWDKIALSIDTF